MPGSSNNIYGLDFTIAGKLPPKKDGTKKPSAAPVKEEPKERVTGFGPASDKPKEPPPKEIQFINARFEPGALDGFAPNKNCRVTGRAEFLCETNLTKCTLTLFTIFNGQTENTCLNESKYGTAYIDKKTGEFSFPTVPLYLPSEYPDLQSFSSPVRYKGVISATRQTAPLEFFLDLPDNSVPKPPLLKKGKFDDNGLTNHKSVCDASSPEYCKGTAVTKLQKRLIGFRYLHHKHPVGLFDDATDKALRYYQKDSLDTLRLNATTKKLTAATMVTFTGTENGEYDDPTAKEMAQWQVENFLGPMVELYENDFDAEAVAQKLRSYKDKEYHEAGKPVVAAQKQLRDVGAYTGKLHGNFDKEMKAALVNFQDAAASGSILDTVNKRVTLPTKLHGHMKGVYDTATQLFLKECVANKWKIEQVALGVRACEGPLALKHNEKGVFKVTTFSRQPTGDETKKICWSVRLDGKEVEKHEAVGDSFEFHAIGKYVGETLTVHPYINKPADTVKVTTTVGNYLLFDGRELHLYNEKLKKVQSWSATSGVKGASDPSDDKGPLPVGKWAMLYNKRETTANKDQKEFGTIRYELFPFHETEAYKRNGFFIHGGKEAGTAHGIDLVDKIEDFADAIEKVDKDMVLVVKKPNGEPIVQIKSVDDKAFRFPLDAKYHNKEYHNGMRRFGSSRNKGRFHAGCDLYAPLAAKIFAVADGEIKAYYNYYWKTFALEVDHGDFTILYGEVQPPSDPAKHGITVTNDVMDYISKLEVEEKKGLPSILKINSKVKKGEHIAYVGQLYSQGGSTPFEHTMLHLEKYKKSATGRLTQDYSGVYEYLDASKKNLKFMRRKDLENPTQFLDECTYP